MTNNNAANRDFVSYWAAGQRLVHRANPYDAVAIFSVEKSAGLNATRPLIMRNPPFALFLTVPLGLVGEKTGAVLWSMLILVCLMVSIRLLWRMHGSPPGRLHLLGYLFAPALACLLAGQTSIFVLLGLTLFLYLYPARQTLAGAALLLCALKPHLFLPFGVALFAWIVVRKAYRVLAGAALATGIAGILPFLFDPSIYRHYAAMTRTAGMRAEFIPNLSVLLRVAVNKQFFWLQLLPALAGCLWALWYFSQHRNEWDWRTHGSLLMLVSILVAPYSWFTDEVVLLPAILQAIYFADTSPRNSPLLWFAAADGMALVEVLFGVQLYSGLYIWTPAAWLAWYLFSTRSHRNANYSALAANEHRG
ncbi:MAG: glycosyltransferase family 87 protein [Acidobacteriaceae bacterium]